MRFLHLADLHLGKRLKEFNLIDDQRYVLLQALALAKNEALDAVVLAGDIYDSSVPSAEATDLLDEFVTGLYAAHIPVLMISGNHDSAEKLGFASRILSSGGVHVVTRVEDSVTPVVIADTAFYLLPYVRPYDVNAAFQTSAKNIADALQEVLQRMPLDPALNHVLVLHQAVLPEDGALTLGGSEEVYGVEIGDLMSVPSPLFKAFDYVALGHIHKPQKVGAAMFYPGALLKYHQDESAYPKEFLLVKIERHVVSIEKRPYRLAHDVVKAEGTLDEILHSSRDPQAYLFARLTDPVLVDNAMAKLRSKFPFAAGIEYMRETAIGIDFHDRIDVEKTSPEELFTIFFEKQTGHPLSAEEKAYVHPLLKKGDAQ